MIITFYSYKGGVGRSMALANVANWLRLQRLRVAVVDWDLEAPGIECFFLPPGQRERVQASPGLIDLIEAYRQLHARLPLEFFSLDSKPRFDGSDVSGQQAALERRIALLARELPPLSAMMVELAPHFQRSDALGGPISLLSPGVRDGKNRFAYARDVQSLDWGKFYEEYDGEAFFGWLRRELDTAFDVTLIDSRTGMTEVGGICTREMADFVICLCAPNAQNLEGTALLVRSLFAEELRIARHGRDLTAAIIPARYDNGESDLLLGFEKEFRKVVKQLRAESPNSFSAGLDPDKSWELRVVYTPKYAYHERLCVGADDANPDLLEDYSALARFVAERALPRLEPSRREQLARESTELAALLPTTRRDPVSVKERLDRTFAELTREIQEHLPALLTRFVSVPNRGDLADLALVRQRLDEFSPEERQWLQTLERSGLLVIDAESEGESSEARADALVNVPMGIRHVRLADSNALQEWPELRTWTNEAMPLIAWRYELDHQIHLMSRRPSPGLTREVAELVFQQFVDLEDTLPRYTRHGLSVSQRRFIEECSRLNASKVASPRASSEEAPAPAPRLRSAPRWLLAALATFALAAVAIWGFPLVLTGQTSAHYGSSATVPSGSQTGRDDLAKTLMATADRQVKSDALDDAIASYSQALPYFDTEDKVTAYLGRGGVYLRKEDYAAAWQDFDQAVRAAPNNKDAYALRARAGSKLYLAANANPDARPSTSAPAPSESEVLADFQRAIEATHEPNLYLERGKFSYRLGHVQEAADDFERAITEAKKNNQNIPEAHYQLAIAKEALGEPTAAVAQYTRAIELDPALWAARYNRALALPKNSPQGIEDLSKVAANAGDSDLRVIAERALKERTPKAAPQDPPTERRIAIHFTNPEDRERVAELRKVLSDGSTIWGPELVTLATSGDVRYFFNSDKAFAEQTRQRTNLALGVTLPLSLLPSNAFPKARPGAIEIWLPALPATKQSLEQKGMVKKR